jgi:hypothetical protein
MKCQESPCLQVGECFNQKPQDSPSSRNEATSGSKARSVAGGGGMRVRRRTPLPTNCVQGKQREEWVRRRTVLGLPVIASTVIMVIEFVEDSEPGHHRQTEVKSHH